LLQNFSVVQERLRKAVPALMDAIIVNVISRFATAALADEVVQFFEKNPVPSSSRRISQTVETIRTNAALGDKLRSSPLVEPAFWA
jgi:hypothetical protein